MKKFNLDLSLVDKEIGEDFLRGFNKQWNTPDKQPCNGSEFRNGKFFMDWDACDHRMSRAKGLQSKVEGIIRKNVGKKFSEVFHKFCLTDASKELSWGRYRTGKDLFLEQFKCRRWRTPDFIVDKDGLIQVNPEVKPRPKPRRGLKVYYDKPVTYYKVNHDNIRSIKEVFIDLFGYDAYYKVLAANTLSEDQAKKFMDFKSWIPPLLCAISSDFCHVYKKKRYYYYDGFTFCFTKVGEYYKFIPYGTKFYWKVLKERKRKERQYLASKKNHSEGDKILKEKKIPKSIKKLRKKAKKLKENDMVVDGKS